MLRPAFFFQLSLFLTGTLAGSAGFLNLSPVSVYWFLHPEYISSGPQALLQGANFHEEAVSNFLPRRGNLSFFEPFSTFFWTSVTAFSLSPFISPPFSF